MKIIDKIKFCNTFDKVSDNIYCATISQHANSKNELFAQLEHTLNLPSYFGHNWDALDECLCDLHWIKLHKVIIAHKVLPTLTLNDFKTYLDILLDAFDYWINYEEHSLEIQFHKNYEAYIKSLIQN